MEELFLNDKTPHSIKYIYENIFSRVDYEAYRYKIAQVEAAVSLLPAGETIGKEYLQGLDEQLDIPEEGLDVRFTGWLQQEIEDEKTGDVSYGEPIWFFEEELIFGGAYFDPTRDGVRVVFGFSTFADENGVAAEYSAPFEALYEVEEISSEVVDWADVTAELYTWAQKITTSEHFLSSDESTRQGVLDEICREAKLELSQFISVGEQMCIEAPRYFAISYATLDDQARGVYQVDQTQLSVDEQQSIKGVVKDVIYPEQGQLECSGLPRSQELLYGDGGPCLLIDGIDTAAVYIVPFRSVSALDERSLIGE